MHTLESARALDYEQLLDQIRLLNRELANRHEAGLADALRQVLAEDAEVGDPEPVAVSFGTWEWDNGWFYNPGEGLIFYADGTHAVWDFEGVRDKLANLSGDAQSIGGESGLLVNLRTGAVEHEGYRTVMFEELRGVSA